MTIDHWKMVDEGIRMQLTSWPEIALTGWQLQLCHHRSTQDLIFYTAASMQGHTHYWVIHEVSWFWCVFHIPINRVQATRYKFKEVFSCSLESIKQSLAWSFLIQLAAPLLLTLSRGSRVSLVLSGDPPEQGHLWGVGWSPPLLFCWGS